jgi:hypothetical protein
MASRLFRASFRALRVRPATMLLKPTLQPRLVQPRLIQPQLFQRAFTVNLPRFNNGEGKWRGAFYSLFSGRRREILIAKF